MFYYLAYGSNLSKEVLLEYCPSAQLIKTLFLENYTLEFRGKINKGYLTIKEKANSKIPIVIWKINKSDLASLDDYEDYPNLYKKVIFKININNNEHEVLSYIMNQNYPFQKPTEQYWKIVNKAYDELNFDKNILLNAYKNRFRPILFIIFSLKLILKNWNCITWFNIKFYEFISYSNFFKNIIKS